MRRVDEALVAMLHDLGGLQVRTAQLASDAGELLGKAEVYDLAALHSRMRALSERLSEARKDAAARLAGINAEAMRPLPFMGAPAQGEPTPEQIEEALNRG